MEELGKYLVELEKKALAERKLLAFSLEFPKTGEGFYLLPQKESGFAVIGACKIFNTCLLKEVLEKIDGKVDYVFIDVEGKNEKIVDVEKITCEVLKKTKVVPVKVNDFTAMAADLFVSQLVDLFNKKVVIIGAGNIGSKLALKLSERGSDVYVSSRNIEKLKVVVNGLNKIKTGNKKINIFDNDISVFDNAHVIIGFAPSGTPVISKEMIEKANENVIVIDGGIGNIQKEALELDRRFLRLDTRNGVYGYIDASIKTDQFIGKDLGKREIGGKIFVAGGVIGKENDIIIDSVKNTQSVIGLADGKGGLKRESLDNVNLDEDIDKELFKQRFVFRIDGGSSDNNRPRHEQGMGHISRSLVLAEYLKEKGEGVAFIMKPLPGVAKVKEAGFEVYEINEEMDEESQIIEIVRKLYKVNLIIDKLDLDVNYVKKLKPYCRNVITIDNKGYGALYADLNLYPLARMPDKFAANSVESPNLVLLRDVFFPYKDREKIINKEVKKILVTMGGTDPTKTTLKSIKALKKINEIDVSIIVGPGFNFKDEIDELVKDDVRFKILQDVKNMGELLFDTDLAIISGGVTVFEAAFLGTPSIVICHNHGEVDHGFSDYGFALNLGLTDELEHNNVYKAIISLMDNYNERIKMSKTGKSVMGEDGRELTMRLIKYGR